MKALLSLLVSAGVLALLWLNLDRGAILAALSRTDAARLGASLALLVALVGLSAFRLTLLARFAAFRLTGAEAVQATFAANALNMVMPGKLGDLLKAVMMTEGAPARLPGAVALGVWEKLSDLVVLFVVASLALAILGGAPWLALGLGLAGGLGILVLVRPGLLAALFRPVPKVHSLTAQWAERLSAIRAVPFGLAILFGITALIWSGHLLQIVLMTRALGVTCSATCWVEIVGLLPVAIVAGLLPLTFAGVGVRDAALVVLLAPLIGAAEAAALGVLFWLRYLVPGALGAPLLPRFLRDLRRHVAGRRA
ncbi:MAG: lysylphosphatidylglycerol synthase transmembrane domain-containing protein [Roseicyclus sp.]